MNRYLPVLFIGVALVAGCDRRDVPENQPTPQPTSVGEDPETPAEPVAPAGPTADDSLALGLLGAVNKHEIAAAQQAMGKNVSAPVLAYAERMDKEHGENQARTESLGTLASTPEVQAMVDKSQRELQTLGEKSGEAYEAAYVDAMVTGHTEALSLIDGRLLALASAEPVRQHLTETRDHVAMHLEAAKKLQGR